MAEETRACRKCGQAISAERLEEVPVATVCARCLKPRPCERCGQMIDVDRLDANPLTRLCIACIRQVGEDTQIRVQTVNTGKQGSLKKGSTVVGATRLTRKRWRPE